MENTQNCSGKTLAIIAMLFCAITPQPSLCAEQIDESLQAKRIQQIVLSRGNDPAAVAHLVQLSRDLQPSAAVELFVQLAEEYLRAGKFDLAGEVLRQLVDQHPDQPATTGGLITLVQLYTSSEISYTTQQTSRLAEDGQLAVYALYLAEQAMQKQSSLADNPALTFQCAVAARLSGSSRSAKGWLSPLKHNRRLQPWHDCARAEAWLQSPRKETSPKPTIHCSPADDRPLLDGKLDEPLWQVAKTQALAFESTQIKFAHDTKFLYLAIHCQKLDDQTYVADQLPRAHDADLAGQDHVRISLDLDRDYSTCFQLSVDHRGQTADTRWLDASWNPRWFVASSSDNSSWTIEAAIPWDELTKRPPQPQAAWALAVQRQPPTGNPSSWVGPAEQNLAPESFGLLIFD